MSRFGIISLLRFERAYSAIAMGWSFTDTAGMGIWQGGVFFENGAHLAMDAMPIGLSALVFLPEGLHQLRTRMCALSLREWLLRCGIPR